MQGPPFGDRIFSPTGLGLLSPLVLFKVDLGSTLPSPLSLSPLPLQYNYVRLKGQVDPGGSSPEALNRETRQDVVEHGGKHHSLTDHCRR